MWRNCHSILSGIVFDTQGPCVSLVVMGMIFNTREGGGRFFVCVAFPLWCWVSFSIPVRAEGCAFLGLGIVFDTRDGEELLAISHWLSGVI